MNQSQLRMKSQDIVILFKILSKGEKEWYHHTIAKELHMSQSEVSESLKRSSYSGLIDSSRKKVSKLSLIDFIEFGIKYTFPQKPGPIARGFPTVHSAPPLNNIILSDEIYVWPDSLGSVKGQSIIPLYKSVTKAIVSDPKLYEFLVLVDSVRIGKVREIKLAVKLLREKCV